MFTNFGIQVNIPGTICDILLLLLLLLLLLFSDPIYLQLQCFQIKINTFFQNCI